MQSGSFFPKTFFILLMIHLIASSSPCTAKMYKYKGEDGIWHFSDTPPSGYHENLKEEDVDGERMSDLSDLPDLEARLIKQLNPHNAIESATLATLSIQSPIGFGSGFFISNQGHIITNKHVIRVTENEEKRKVRHYEETETKIKSIEKKFSMEAERLDKYKRNLDDFKAFIQNQPESDVRRLNQQRFDFKLAEYQSWEKNFRQRQKNFQKEKDQVLWEQSKAKRNDSLAYLNRSFTVFTADNAKYYAYLVAVSKHLDLALLKLDGFKTPFLKSISPNMLITGKQVYAIGNPAELHNSVTSGILSGIEGDYAKTNAQIYPGNSGGPLITPDGKVIGVNTFKRLTYKFEGLGFAVLIDRVFNEFEKYIDR